MKRPLYILGACAASVAVVVLACSRFAGDDLSSGDDAGRGDADPNDASSGQDGGSEPDGASEGGARTAYLIGAGGSLTTDRDVGSSTSIFARILPDGRLGQWMNGPDLPTARRRHGVIGIGDSLHVVGGATPTQKGVPDVTTTRLANDAGFGPFAAAPPLADYNTDSCPAIVDGRTYVVRPGTAEAQYATVVPGGFGGWQKQTGLDGGAGTYYGQEVAVGNLLFWFGYDGKVIVSTVAADGSLGEWRALPPMPTRFADGAGVAATDGKHIYLLGGIRSTGDGTPSTDVFVAAATDVGVGEWQATEPYSVTRYFASVVAHGDYLYVIGGDRGVDILDVSFAKIRPDGTLDPWAATTPLPVARRGPCVFGVVVR